jgi:hypothetical protein
MISLEAKKRYQETRKKFHQTKRGHVLNYVNKAKLRAKRKNLDFDLDLEYVLSIAPDKCPVFGTEFVWGRFQGAQHRQTPSLDRVVPELGYIKGNVVFISLWANMIKSDATDKELYAVADWLHEKRKEVLNAFKSELTPLSKGDYRESEIYPKLGPFSAAGTRQDNYYTHHYSGTISGQDADYRTQTRGGDSVGCRGEEVGAPATIEGEQDNWQLHPTYGWIER